MIRVVVAVLLVAAVAATFYYVGMHDPRACTVVWR